MVIKMDEITDEQKETLRNIHIEKTENGWVYYHQHEARTNAVFNMRVATTKAELLEDLSIMIDMMLTPSELPRKEEKEW